MMNLRKVTGVVACISLGWAAQARADVVTDWNAIAVQTTLAAVPPRPGPTVILDMATVHLAVHDAIQAIEGRYESYGDPIPNASGSPIAAAATAAHDVLVARFPAQAADLDTQWTSYLGSLGLLGNAGVDVGHAAATAIITMRADDGSFPSSPEVFVGGTDPGQWRPTPPAFAPMTTPWLGAVVPFSLKDSTQLEASPPPPHLKSGEYLNDYDEVKALGSLTSTARTPEQTALALFYSDNFIVLWQRTLRGIAAADIHNISDSGFLFAMANMASADAVITAWADKRYWNFWRPITAIREGDNDGNPRTAGDSTWVPYLVTPPYADYTSGANNLTGAMTRTLANVFGDKTTFTVSSTSAGVSKTYERFSDMADDVVNVRIYQGIHFRTADEVARRQGTRSADWAFSHHLRPLN